MPPPSSKLDALVFWLGIVPIPVWRETGMGFYLMSGEATIKVKEIPHESRMAYYKLLE